MAPGPNRQCANEPAAETTASQPGPVTMVPETTASAETEPEAAVHHRHHSYHYEERKPSFKALKVVLWTIAGIVILLALFIVLSRVAPHFIDKLLYTKEELEILYY